MNLVAETVPMGVLASALEVVVEVAVAAQQQQQLQETPALFAVTLVLAAPIVQLLVIYQILIAAPTLKITVNLRTVSTSDKSLWMEITIN